MVAAALAGNPVPTASRLRPRLGPRGRSRRSLRHRRRDVQNTARGDAAGGSALRGRRPHRGRGPCLGGAINVWSRRGPLPVDIEQRIVNFTELIATAIANADVRSKLTQSRARIVATADATRRRIERDLHDGAQQRLVSLALELRLAQESVPAEPQRLGTASGESRTSWPRFRRSSARYRAGSTVDPVRGRARAGGAHAGSALPGSGRVGHPDQLPVSGVGRWRRTS